MTTPSATTASWLRGQRLGDDGQLDRAGDADDGGLSTPHSAAVRSADSSSALGDLLVPAGRHDRERQPGASNGSAAARALRRSRRFEHVVGARLGGLVLERRRGPAGRGPSGRAWCAGSAGSPASRASAAAPGRRSRGRSPPGPPAWPGCWSAAAWCGCRGRPGSARRCRSRGRRPAGRARGWRRRCRTRRPAAGRPAACASGRCRGPRARARRARRRAPPPRRPPAPRRAAGRSRSGASRRRRRSGTRSARGPARPRRRRCRRGPARRGRCRRAPTRSRRRVNSPCAVGILASATCSTWFSVRRR